MHSVLYIFANLHMPYNKTMHKVMAHKIYPCNLLQTTLYNPPPTYNRSYAKFLFTTEFLILCSSWYEASFLPWTFYEEKTN